MGSCSSSDKLCQRAYQWSTGAAAEDCQLPDTSDWELEDLVRAGIAEAQEASSAQCRRVRMCHVRLARGYLMAAVKRCGRGEEGGNPEVCAHLLAVLLKLGQDAESVQGILAECVGAGVFGGASGANGGGSPISGPSPGEDEIQPPSDHSSEEEIAPRFDYDEMQENFLARDSSDDEEEAEADETGVSLMPIDVSLVDGPASPTVIPPASMSSQVLDGVGLRVATLSPVQEGDDQVGEGQQREHHFQSAGPGSPVNSEAAWPENQAAPWPGTGCNMAGELGAEGDAQELAGKLRIDSGLSASAVGACEAAGSARLSPAGDFHQPWSPASGHRGQRAHVRNAVDDAAAAAALTNAWPLSGKGTGRAGHSWGGDSSPSSPTASSKRSMQPQQATSSSGFSKRSERFRLASTRGSGQQFTVTETSGVDAATSIAFPTRIKRRQPSQSSSSGSQNASDSETGSAVMKRMIAQGEVLKEQSRTATINEESSNNSWPAGDAEPVFGKRKPWDGPGGEALATGAVLFPSRTHSRKPSWSDHQTAGVPTSPKPPTRHSTGGVLDTLSLAGSYAPSMVPSMAPSPFNAAAVPRPEVSTPPAAQGGFSAMQQACSASQGANTSDEEMLRVQILNGVSGEEEVRFLAPLQANSEQLFLEMLDRLCLQHSGQSLAGLNWLSREGKTGDRFHRRKCDLRMVEELWDESQASSKGVVLLLCTVPVQPPTELTASKVRLKGIAPARVSCGAPQPLRLQLDTSMLEDGREYSVAFTHQWTNMTYSAEATPMQNSKGVEVTVPWQMLTTSSNSMTDGLYDVHLVIDQSWRSENRRTLTVGSAESELSSSSTAKSEATSAFEPIRSET